jgi:signal transduction histidine kinase
MWRPVGLALLPFGIAFGLIAESQSTGGAWSASAAADFAVGCVLIACGVIAWDRRPESRVGALLTLTGFTWFLGTLFERALYLHRGPLVQLVLSYPTGRLRARFAQAAVVAAYVDGAIEPLAANGWATLALGGLIALSATGLFVGTSGPARRAAGPALAAALAFAGVLALAAVQQLVDWNAHDPVLWTYDVVVAAIAILLVGDLLGGRWRDAVVTSLVVDLGAHGQVGTLRAKLARALGDPTLVVGYRLPETGSFVDDAGRPVDVRSPGPGRTVTAIDDRGEHLAVLVHDNAVLADPELVKSIAAAARLAVGNARLQAEARARASELEASRRRIVEAGAAQRQRLEAELRFGAERRLDNVAALLADARGRTGAGDDIAGLEAALVETRRELREFAQGVHPRTLTDGGLMPALELLAARSPVPVDVRGSAGRLPAPVEAALFFVCSEALANAAKHAAASCVTIDVRQDGYGVVVAVADDGRGGADASRGTGLRGLADRVEALGGSFRVESSNGAGTRVVAATPSEIGGHVPGS